MSFVARPLRLVTTDGGFQAALKARLHWSAETNAQVESTVTAILADVRERGDAAVLEYTARWDRVNASSMTDRTSVV